MPTINAELIFPRFRKLMKNTQITVEQAVKKMLLFLNHIIKKNLVRKKSLVTTVEELFHFQKDYFQMY